MSNSIYFFWVGFVFVRRFICFVCSNRTIEHVTIYGWCTRYAWKGFHFQTICFPIQLNLNAHTHNARAEVVQTKRTPLQGFFWILSAIHLTLHPLECMQGILIFFFWFRQIAMHSDSHDLPRCQIKQQIMKNKTFLTAFHLKSCQYYNVYVPCMLLFEISLLFVSF